MTDETVVPEQPSDSESSTGAPVEETTPDPPETPDVPFNPDPTFFTSWCEECGATFESNVSYGNTVMEKLNHKREMHS